MVDVCRTAGYPVYAARDCLGVGCDVVMESDVLRYALVQAGVCQMCVQEQSRDLRWFRLKDDECESWGFQVTDQWKQDLKEAVMRLEQELEEEIAGDGAAERARPKTALLDASLEQERQKLVQAFCALDEDVDGASSLEEIADHDARLLKLEERLNELLQRKLNLYRVLKPRSCQKGSRRLLALEKVQQWSTQASSRAKLDKVAAKCAEKHPKNHKRHRSE